MANCNNTNNVLRIVRGNAFAIQINVKALRADGTEIQDFSLADSDAVALITVGKNQMPTPFDISGNSAIIAFDGHQQQGVYGLDMSGVFRDEKWRFCTRLLFEVVETSVQANIPEGCILYDDTYIVGANITLYTTGPQADWDETDPTKQSYIKNKPDLSVYATNEALETEESRAKAAEKKNADDIADEIIRAKAAEKQNADDIDAEEIRAKAAEKQNADDIDALEGRMNTAENDIDTIEGKIPAAASSSNKLVDEQKMNSSISTATATYRGAYNEVTDLSLTVAATHAQIEAALATKMSALGITPDNNDYAFVQIPTADATPTEIARIERYKFNGTAWAFEYALNNSGFTAAQWAAINSGITSGLVTKLSDLPTNAELTTLLNGKQDTISDLQTIREGAAAGATAYQKPSGGIPSSDMTSEVQQILKQVGTNTEDISTINGKIPSAASSSNKLVDQQQMNSSISTATATYRGAYNEVTDLSLTVAATHAQIEAALAAKMTALSITPDNNDYTFVQVPTADTTPTEIARVERYKFNGTDWVFEYALNNSGFTAAQWAALNSGITSGLVTKLNNLPTNVELTTLLNGKQDTISDLQTIREGAAAGATAVQPAAIANMEVNTNKVTSLSSQSTDTQYPSAKAVFEFVKEETGKARETVQVTATADSGSVSASAVLKVKVNDEVVAQGTGSVNIALEYGTQYTVEAERVYDYLTPASQTFTAGQSVRTVTMAYTYIQRDTITIDQTETDELTMVSGDVQGQVIQAIRAASHLYLGTQTEEGNQLICQLKDDDGTKYADGTTAAMDGTEGDQWLKLPVFWWKVTGIGTPDESNTYDQYSFSFAFAGEPDPSWHKWEGDMALIGAKEMYVSDGKGYSRSGIQSTGSSTQAQYNTYAEARGEGYCADPWEWQWIMCILFYAWYGRTNSQAQCGSGSNSYQRTLGTKDSLGMTDTTAANGNADNTKFWGIENWWGDKAEWVGNITSQDYVVSIKNMITGIIRIVSGWMQFGGTGGYASRFKITDDLDFIPVAKNGTETTCYCDWVNGNSGSRVVARSDGSAVAGGGVAFVDSVRAPSVTSAYIGSRLAFIGTITEAESVAAYKAALA